MRQQMPWLASMAGTAVACATVLVAPTAARQQPALPQALTDSMAGYAQLTSYGDTGTVTSEASGTIERARFTTAFRRASRDFLLDYQTISSTTVATKFSIDLSAYRTVIWMFKGEMQKYDRYMKTHETVDPANGGQTRALQSAAYGSKGVSILIPSLLYSRAGLQSTLALLQSASLAGTEALAGRDCQKFVGVAAEYLRSGQPMGARPVTVWVDIETKLIRRVFEDTPKEYASNAYRRVTIDLEPRANPPLADAQFQFSVPAR